MREIKFKALKDDMSNCNFIYGDYIDSLDGKPLITNDGGHTYHTCLIGTLGQFTGLKDKNGIDIYEGDIIQNEYNQVGSVMYNESYAAFTVWFGIDFGLIDDESTIKVIGNIHEK